MRVHELAKELGVTSKEILAALQSMGIEAGTASSSVPEAAVPRLRASGGKPVPAAKPKEAKEEAPSKPRARRTDLVIEAAMGPSSAAEVDMSRRPRCNEGSMGWRRVASVP